MKFSAFGSALVVAMGLLLPSVSLAISTGAFGAAGQGGIINGQSFDIGPGGVVFEVDGFVNIGGQDLNGGTSGTSAQLSVDSLPAGLDYSFSSSLSDANTDITLTYSFTNNTGAAIADLRFISFLDAEIDEVINTFFNEVAATNGVLAAGQGFEADEPGYLFGDISSNILAGSLDNSNIFPPADDVSMALSFQAALLGVDETFIIEIMISEDGDTLGSFSILQTDPESSPATTITYSGEARIVGEVIPEPNAALLFGVGALVFGRAFRQIRSS